MIALQTFGLDPAAIHAREEEEPLYRLSRVDRKKKRPHPPEYLRPVLSRARVSSAGKRRLPQGSTAQPRRFPEVSAVWDVGKAKTLQTGSNSYPWISIASERWIDSMEINSFPFSCFTSIPSNPCKQPPQIRTRCPACTKGCRENRPFSRNSNCRSSICFAGTAATFPPKLTKPIRPAVRNTASR